MIAHFPRRRKRNWESKLSMIHSKAPAMSLDPAGANVSPICVYALAFYSTLK